MAGKPSSLVDFPPEIISEIFIHCLPWMIPPQRGSYPFQNIRPQTGFDSNNAPLLLIHICHQWRLIVEATPRLWTRLPKTRFPGALGLYEMYIKNSGQAPLWVDLTFDSDAREIADILMSHSHRWERLTLEGRRRGALPNNPVTHKVPAKLPTLKHLQITPTFPIKHDVYKLSTFQAPLLRSVEISSSRVPCLNLPWSQLTHYSGEFSLLQDATAVLSLCTNLEVLHLHDPRQFLHTARPVPSLLHLPRLQDLSLINKSVHFSDHRPLIDCLIVPALEKVCISADNINPVLETLCKCIVRSSPDGTPCLRSVEVQCFQSLDRLGLQELSLVAPCIQELRISRPSSEALFAMGFHPTNPPLFPCLQHLTLIDPLLKGYELVDIIDSRCHPPPDSQTPMSLCHVEVMSTEELAPMIRSGMVQPFHEEFQDVAENFTDDPNFKQMCERLKSILTIREIAPDFSDHQLPSHWGRSISDPLLCFFEFSDSVFTFFENYKVHHPLLLSRHPAVSLLREFLCGNLGSSGPLKARQQEFLNRASALINKWQPIITEYSKKERWIVETVDKSYSLVRKAEESTHKVVYYTSS
ncbi:hypothetical protein BD779DRAFT_1474206 [Infundibulicybe gibba]|nr:hypothetical protein BD779DRAFT_1474206 [Infundibulicybe gibba]